MRLLLLAVIYIAFIGLGLPDSLFGTAWPAIYADFGLPISFGSFISVTVATGTMISSLTSAWVTGRLGTGRVTALSTMLTALALLGFSFAPNLWCMVLLAVPLGIGAGAIDVALNNYVALHYSASQMSFLHCFYGVGVSVSPYILSLVISGPSGWRTGYRIAFLIQAAVTVLLLLALPLWRPSGRAAVAAAAEAEAAVKPLSPRQTWRIPGVRQMCILFVLTCAIECTCSGWGSTYLVEHRGLAPDRAAEVILLYFVGMALGRFLSGVLAARLRSWTIILLGEGILCAAVVLLLLPGPAILPVAGLFLIGLGNGPLFPNFNYLAPETFGREVSQSVISLQMAFAYGGILLGPLFCGLLGQAAGMFIFPLYLLAFCLVMAAVTRSVRRLLNPRAQADGQGA